MTKPVPNPPPGFDTLTIDEKIEYVQSLWERITVSAEEVPVPDCHKRILNDRLRAYRSDPEAVRPWEQVREEIERNLSQPSDDKP